MVTEKYPGKNYSQKLMFLTKDFGGLRTTGKLVQSLV